MPPDAEGRHLKIGKLEVRYPTETSVELKTAFEREFKVVFPKQAGEIEVLCNGKHLKKKDMNITGTEVEFKGMPGKDYIAKLIQFK